METSDENVKMLQGPILFALTHFFSWLIKVVYFQKVSFERQGKVR